MRRNATQRNSIIQSSNRYWGFEQRGSLPRLYQRENYAGARKEFIDCRGERNVCLSRVYTYTPQNTRVHPFRARSPPRACVTNVSRGKYTLARLHEAELVFLENPFDQNNDVPPHRFLSSFTYDRCKLFNENYSFFPGHRNCVAATFFPVFLFILYVNRDITGKLHFSRSLFWYRSWNVTFINNSS